MGTFLEEKKSGILIMGNVVHQFTHSFFISHRLLYKHILLLLMTITVWEIKNWRKMELLPFQMTNNIVKSTEDMTETRAK